MARFNNWAVSVQSERTSEPLINMSTRCVSADVGADEDPPRGRLKLPLEAHTAAVELACVVCGVELG